MKSTGFFDRMYDNMNEAERREFIEQLIEKVEVFEERQLNGKPEDVGILARLARKEPASYASIAMRPGGLQDYVDVWNELI